MSLRPVHMSTWLSIAALAEACLLDGAGATPYDFPAAAGVHVCAADPAKGGCVAHTARIQ